MRPQNPHFEVRPSLIIGDTADVYLHRTQRILRNEGINPTVTMEFSSTQAAILCGTEEVRAVLERVTSVGNREVWAVEEGREVADGEVCLSVRAPYSSFGLYETAICGILADSTGWATAANDLVRAANGIPMVSVGAHNVHPSVAPIMDYSAVVGGCESVSTVLGNKLSNTVPIATVSGALLQLMGDPGKAAAAFDRSVAPDIPRVAYVDPRGDVVAQTVAIAHLMKDRLDAVRLARTPGATPIPLEAIKQVREQLDAIGANRVEIILSGPMTPQRIKDLVDAKAPVDVFHDSGYIAAAASVPFRPNIRNINDLPVQQESEPPPPNPHLMRLL
jgi:nicotinate phosphoribosyltransferase